MNRMNRLPTSLVLALAAIVVSIAAGPARAQSDLETIERGRQLYMANGCFSCHGTVGQGGERSSARNIGMSFAAAPKAMDAR